jgi:hypothetical protein
MHKQLDSHGPLGPTGPWHPSRKWGLLGRGKVILGYVGGQRLSLGKQFKQPQTISLVGCTMGYGSRSRGEVPLSTTPDKQSRGGSKRKHLGFLASPSKVVLGRSGCKGLCPIDGATTAQCRVEKGKPLLRSFDLLLHNPVG